MEAVHGLGATAAVFVGTGLLIKWAADSNRMAKEHYKQQHDLKKVDPYFQARAAVFALDENTTQMTYCRAFLIEDIEDEIYRDLGMPSVEEHQAYNDDINIAQALKANPNISITRTLECVDVLPQGMQRYPDRQCNALMHFSKKTQ